MEPHDYRIHFLSIDLRHQYGISVAESQTFLRAKRPQRRRARRNGCFRRLVCSSSSGGGGGGGGGGGSGSSSGGGSGFRVRVREPNNLNHGEELL